MSEHSEQCALFDWAEYHTYHIPELAYLFAIPNGGWRHKATAGRLKAEGLKAGVPDVCLPVPRGDYAGLWIEMKWGSNKPTKNQRRWLDFLAGQGYQTAVCRGWEDARDEVLRYLDNDCGHS